jgi:phosphoribosylformimino-5-aminoimidazole carboxamide ribotide isomerase
VRAVLDAVNLQCELGGGIRDEAAIEAVLDLGLSRLVLGTSALKRPEWFRLMATKFPKRLVLGVDARNGKVATEGWLETSATSATQLVEQFDDLPLAAIVYTDIATDGMLQGPNVAAMRAMQEATTAPVVASGGVTTADDVAALAAAGLAGAIVGRALYEGTLTLRDALEAAALAPSN